MKNGIAKFVLSLVLVSVFSTASNAQVYTRATDVLPWIQPQLVNAAYWIGKMEKPDEVILTPAQIEAKNRDYEQRINAPDPFKGLPKESVPDLFYWWPGLPRLSRISLKWIPMLSQTQ
jgi:hypothetical protein